MKDAKHIGARGALSEARQARGITVKAMAKPNSRNGGRGRKISEIVPVRLFL